MTNKHNKFAILRELPSGQQLTILQLVDNQVEEQMNAVLNKLDAMEAKFDAKFYAMEAKFDAKFEAMDAKFEAMDAKFEAKFDAVDSKFESIEKRLSLLLWGLPLVVTIAISIAVPISQYALAINNLAIK